MISFWLNIDPPKVTSQTKRIQVIHGKPRFFPKKEHKQAEDMLKLLCASHSPQEPFSGPLSLSVDFVFPWRKSESKRTRGGGNLPMDTRPDCDNLVKLVADVLTSLGFWNDDGQVAVLRVSKSWGDNPGIGVEIEHARRAGP